jgi:hypothetical protein
VGVNGNKAGVNGLIQAVYSTLVDAVIINIVKIQAQVGTKELK